MTIKLREKIDFEFWVYGAKDLQALQPYVNRLAKQNVKVKLFPLLSLEKYHQTLESAAVGLHPICESSLFSLGKSFGKLNSYMLRGVPIVVHRKLDYPDFFRRGEWDACRRSRRVGRKDLPDADRSPAAGQDSCSSEAGF